MENLEEVLGKSMHSFFENLATSRYPKECSVINTFIARGATMHIIRNALVNKFGTSVKTMWLLDYAAICLEKENKHG